MGLKGEEQLAEARSKYNIYYRVMCLFQNKNQRTNKYNNK